MLLLLLRLLLCNAPIVAACWCAWVLDSRDVWLQELQVQKSYSSRQCRFTLLSLHMLLGSMGLHIHVIAAVGCH